LLAIWRAHGLDAILREAWERGVVLGGISAGSMCWFAAGVTKGSGVPRAVEGLGFLPASNSVHYGSEPERRGCFFDAVRSELAPPGYAVDDGVALLFRGLDLVEAVSARPRAGASWVDADGAGGVVETALELRRLPDPCEPSPAVAIEEFRRTRAMRGSATNRPARSLMP
jgi:peptidase E